jgi:hypothetical protein
MGFINRLNLWVRRYGWRVALILAAIAALIRALQTLAWRPH